MAKMYYVIGGIFTDTSFSQLEPNGGEMHGPYATEEEAEKVRDGRMRRNVDICCHRLFTVPVEVTSLGR